MRSIEETAAEKTQKISVKKTKDEMWEVHAPGRKPVAFARVEMAWMYVRARLRVMRVVAKKNGHSYRRKSSRNAVVGTDLD